MNNNLIVQVRLTREGTTSRGTGYVLCPDRILTTGHLGSGGEPGVSINVGQKVELRFMPESVGAPMEKREATVVWSGSETRDAAVLQCDEIPEFVVAQAGYRLSVDRPCEKGEWESVAWCRAGEEVLPGRKVSEPVAFHGFVKSMTTATGEVTLTCTDPPDDKNGWDGASGAPVFTGDELVAVINRRRKNFEVSRLAAVAMADLLAIPEFRDCLPLNPEEEERFLADRREHYTGVLLRMLGQLQESDLAWGRLVERCAVASGDKPEDNWLKKMYEKLQSDSSLLNRVEAVRHTESDPQAKLRLGALIDSLLPIWIPASLTRRIYQDLELNDAVVLSHVAGHAVGAEVVASYVQQRAPRWKRGPDDVHGEGMLKLPEQLSKHDTVDAAAVFIDTIAAILNGKVGMPDGQHALNEMQAGKVLPKPPASERLADHKLMLPATMEHHIECESTVPYCIVSMEPDGDGREATLSMIRLVKETLPGLLFIELSQTPKLRLADNATATPIRIRLKPQ